MHTRGGDVYRPNDIGLLIGSGGGRFIVGIAGRRMGLALGLGMLGKPVSVRLLAMPNSHRSVIPAQAGIHSASK
jgi:hypothetical protein